MIINQFYIFLTPEDKHRVLKEMVNCVKVIRYFLHTHNPLLNNDKTEMLTIDSKQQLNKVGDLLLYVSKTSILPHKQQEI